MNCFYSYLKEENDDDSFFYTFPTNQNLLFTVYFKSYDYQDKLENYPNLLQNGYAFGFMPIDIIPNVRKRKDSLVFPTIYEIMQDFISEKGNETTLLYHCDTLDKKHSYRDKLFNNWEKLIENSNLVRHSLKVQLGVDENNHLEYVYLGFITSKNNPFIDKIREEFDAFQIDLISQKQ